MKTPLLLAALLAPLAAQAAPLPGAQSNVTLKLTAHDSEFVSETPNGYSSKLVTFSYGNKELLADLLAEGLLGEGEKLSGWKLVIVDRTPLAESDGNTLVFYAVKAGKTPVQIPASRFGLQTDSEVGAESEKVTFANDQLASRSSKFKVLVGLTGRRTLMTDADSYDDSFNLFGLASGSDSRVTRSIKVDKVAYPFTFTLLGAVKVSPVLGYVTDHLFDNTQSPVEGSISFSAFTPLDITDYPYSDSSTD